MTPSQAEPGRRLARAAVQDRKERLRRWIGGQLKQPGRALPEPVWQQLLDLEEIGNHLESEESLAEFLSGQDSAEARADLLSSARLYYQGHRKELRKDQTNAKRRADATAPPIDSLRGQLDLLACLSKEERERAEALSIELGRLAMLCSVLGDHVWAKGGQPLVPQFRAYYLGGKRLRRSQAEALMGSIGAAIFEFDFFRANRIPLVGHRSAVVGAPRWSVGKSKPFPNAECLVAFSWAGGTVVKKVGYRAGHIDLTNDELGPFPTGKLRVRVAGRISFLARLTDIAAILSDKLPWSLEESALFVLTGQVPVIRPVDVKVPDYCYGPTHLLARLELVVHPWVSARSLHKVYSRAQRILVGARNRPPKSKSLELFKFVSEQRHGGTSFPEALSAWLESHPAERARYPRGDSSSVARFTTIYRDVERQVMHPFGRDSLKEAKK